MNPYQIIINKYYRSELLNEIELGQSELHNLAANAKRHSEQKWKSFCDHVKKSSLAKFKPRDYSYLTATEYCLATGLHRDEGGQDGVTIYINFLTNLIGFTFSQFRPILIDSVATGKHELLNGYFPITESEKQFMGSLIDYCEIHFPEFEVFNNFYASKLAKNVIVDLGVKEEIEYFKVLFYDDFLIPC